MVCCAGTATLGIREAHCGEGDCVKVLYSHILFAYFQYEFGCCHADKSVINRAYSTHRVESGLWGWAFADGHCSSTLVYGYDTLHIEDLGIFVNFVFYICKYLIKKYGKAKGEALIKELNRRLGVVGDHFRADDFWVPRCGGEYFPKHSKVQAKEHRNVMQALPHILHGIDEDLAEIASRCVAGGNSDAGLCQETLSGIAGLYFHSHGV